MCNKGSLNDRNSKKSIMDLMAFSVCLLVIVKGYRNTCVIYKPLRCKGNINWKKIKKSNKDAFEKFKYTLIKNNTLKQQIIQ